MNHKRPAHMRRAFVINCRLFCAKSGKNCKKMTPQKQSGGAILV